MVKMVYMHHLYSLLESLTLCTSMEVDDGKDGLYASFV